MKYKNKQQGGSEKEFLQNWYSKRKIPDKYLQEALELDKPNIMKRLKSIPDYTYVNDLPNNSTGQFDYKNNRILIKKGISNPDEVKLHELNHYVTYDDRGDYISTEHQNIVNREITPKKYRDVDYQSDYYQDPREVHSRIMVLRKDAGFKPDVPVTEKDLDNYLKKKEVKDSKGNFLHYKLPENVNDIFQNAKDHKSVLNMLNYMAKDNSVKSNRMQLGGQGSLVKMESKEVYKDPNGNIMRVKDNAPTHDDGVLLNGNKISKASYNEGGVVLPAESVLSATHENRDEDDDSYGLIDEIIKIKPKELNQYANVLGFKNIKSNKSVSPSKAFELLRDSKLKQANKLLKPKRELFSDDYTKASIKANEVLANTLPSDEDIYDLLFEIQESKKSYLSSRNKQKGK